MKRFLLSILALWVLSLVTIANANATDITPLLPSDNQLEQIMGTIEYMKLTSEDCVYISSSDGRFRKAFFVYTDKEMIGVLVEDKETGADAFIIDQSDCLFRLVTTEGVNVYLDCGIALKSKENEYQISCNSRVKKTGGELSDGVSVLTAFSGECYEVSSSVAVYLTGIGAEGGFIQVPHVINDINPYFDPDEHVGLCWTASGASIINYYYASAHYTANSLVHRVRSMTGGYPEGNDSYERAMFTLVGRLNYIYEANKATYAKVKASIASGSPLMVSFCTDAIGDSEPVSHAVVLCGTIHISDSYGYIYMDPNVSGSYVVNYLSYSVITSSNNTCFYYAGNTRYTRMYRHFRKFSKM